VISKFQEPVRKQVGGRLSSLSTLDPLEGLRKKATFLSGKLTPRPYDDGSCYSVRMMRPGFWSI